MVARGFNQANPFLGQRPIRRTGSMISANRPKVYIDPNVPYEDQVPWFSGGRFGGARSGIGGFPAGASVVDPYEPGMTRQNWMDGRMHNYGYSVMDRPYADYMNWATGQRDFRAAEQADAEAARIAALPRQPQAWEAGLPWNAPATPSTDVPVNRPARPQLTRDMLMNEPRRVTQPRPPAPPAPRFMDMYPRQQPKPRPSDGQSFYM